MTGFLRWVDFSGRDRELMQQTIALFQEHETRDELGLGTIRDVFAESMFPGTTTIQTRLRYFLFVPWIYRALEEGRVTAEQIAMRARREELALIETLLESDDTRGVIGKRAGSGLKRLPSSVYWAGLQRWGICRYDGSQHQYHRAFGELRRMRRARQVPEDEGVELDPLDTWYARLPDPPDDWPEVASFELTADEAKFMGDRIESACRGTVLASLADRGAISDVGAVWRHPNLADLSKALREEVELARRFSLVMHGASLLYNLMLSELAGRDDLAAGYREALAAWADAEESADLSHFDVTELWSYLRERQARIAHGTQHFVTSWSALVSANPPGEVGQLDATRALVRSRERAIKGARSRFTNRRALDHWSGSSGAGRLVFRWPTAQALLNDLRSMEGR